MIILQILIFACAFYLFFPIITAIWATVLAKTIKPVNSKNLDRVCFACVITAYKDLSMTWPLVRALLKQNYPDFEIYLVADSCMGQPIEVKNNKLHLLQPSSPLNSKVASLHYALEEMDPGVTHVAVFDPDNLVPHHFLNEIAAWHQKGFNLVQGKRIAKNVDSTFAALDALGEYYYDYSVRATPFLLGSSSTIAGSGMSIEKKLYKENLRKEMEELNAKGVVVSEDKSLQLQMVQKGERIAYASKAVVFDEKVIQAHQIGKQRGRWLNSYFRHSKDALGAFFKGLLSLDWNLTFFAIVVLMPPMVVLVGMSLALLIVTLVVAPIYGLLLFAALCLFAAGFLLILLLNRTPKSVLLVIPKIPLFVFGQLSGFMNIRKANKDFMPTEHTQKMEIEEVWEKRKGEFE
ncbi:glycosyltransferase [Pleomorphovibrio marinus]|uniref:glycosyltransferase n=1 Tax=Pleomorphovibrio marinus TaxID=2164132 RepID=UPI000E0BE4D5|nr:glycosyltransferase [Pleomorphovibrio marinus]